MKRKLNKAAMLVALAAVLTAAPLLAADRRPPQRTASSRVLVFLDSSRTVFTNEGRGLLRWLEILLDRENARVREDRVRRGGQSRQTPLVLPRQDALRRDLQRSRPRFPVVPEVD